MLKRRRIKLAYLDRSTIDPQLRRISRVVVAMFLTLMVAATTIQVVFSQDLLDDPRNVRVRYANATVHRGAIIVGEDEIAYSIKNGKNYQRTYSKPEIYAGLTGYFNNTQGMNGLEMLLNAELSGTSDDQFFSRLQNSLSGLGRAGASVTLTVDPALQEAAWNAMVGYRGAMVAIEPKTGRILAMISNPSYDPNLLTSDSWENTQKNYQQLLADKYEPLINRAIAGPLYPPGSIFKLVTMAAALESGRYRLRDEIPQPGRLTFPGRDFYIDDAASCLQGGTITLENALAYSCNATFGRVALELGGKTIKDMADRFGFEKSLEIPLPVSRSWYTLTDDVAQLAQSSFGQWDVRVSPLQAAMITAAIANGGKLMKPNLIENVQSSNLSILREFRPQMLGQPISAQTAADLTTAMESVIQYGTATSGRISNMRIAGKTGTAENGNGKHTLWFTGFAPADDPSIAISLVLEDQTEDAGSLAVPIVRKIIEAAIRNKQG